MSLTLPPIYPITDIGISGLSTPEQVKRLIQGGATVVQLREKNASGLEQYQAAALSVTYAKAHGVKVIINDRVDIAILAKADGVHVGQDDLPPIQARRLLGDAAIIGFSTHNLEQVREAVAMPIDYLAYGPVFATDTKDRPDPVVGIEALRRVKDVAKDLPLVAIGGITRDNVESVLAAGADSAAMISGLLGGPEPIDAILSQLLTITGSNA